MWMMRIESGVAMRIEDGGPANREREKEKEEKEMRFFLNMMQQHPSILPLEKKK